MILNTEARRHRVFVFLSIAHRVNFPSLVCGEAADSVPSRHFPDRKLRNFVFLCLCLYYNLRDKLNLIE